MAPVSRKKAEKITFFEDFFLYANRLLSASLTLHSKTKGALADMVYARDSA